MGNGAAFAKSVEIPWWNLPSQRLCELPAAQRFSPSSEKLAEWAMDLLAEFRH